MILSKKVVKASALILVLFGVFQENITAQDSLQQSKIPTKWFEKINLRGYTQVRFNRLLETNSDLKCEQCDRSIGDGGGIFIRRARLIFSGKLNEKVSFYIQPDLASSIGSVTHLLQLRDAYFDISFDKRNKYRIRIGQSKIPFGFENMQSSSNRLALDRADGINAHLPNERDLAAIFYYTPQRITSLLDRLVNNGLKGSGNYGMLAFGVYNGETANKVSRNNNLYLVGRLTYPLEYRGQILEMSVQGIKGKYTLDAFTTKPGNNLFDDQHLAGSFILYPQPFGIQLEYSVGESPKFNKSTNSIAVSPSNGGYCLLNYQLELRHYKLFPFIKYQLFEGGKKAELDARSYKVKELEIGAEWQINRALELTVQYTMSNRRFEDAQRPDNLQVGNFLRLQAQVNY